MEHVASVKAAVNLIWSKSYVYRRSHSRSAYCSIYSQIKDFFLSSSAIEPISRYMLIIECKQEIYLFTTFLPWPKCSHIWILFPSSRLQFNRMSTERRRQSGSIRLLEIQKQVFEFNLSINSVTHGQIMSAQYYEPTTTFPFKIMSGEPPYPPLHVSAQHSHDFFSSSAI